MAFLLQALYEQTFELNRITYVFLLKGREENNIKQCKFYHYLPNHYKREQKKLMLK